MNNSKKSAMKLYDDVLGINLHAVAAYLHHNCKLSVGYEAQLVGLNISSATTTAFISYVLSMCKVFQPEEERLAVQELMVYAKMDNQQRIHFGTTHPNGWSTAQALLALVQLDMPIQSLEKIVLALNSYQCESGGWTFSNADDESIIYAIYPVLAYLSLLKYRDFLNIICPLERTKKYLSVYAPKSQTEILMRSSLLVKINKELKTPDVLSLQPKPIWNKLISDEFNKLVWNEYTASPFSMSMYGPALYLFARDIVEPDHPFSLYCIRYLIENIRSDRTSWPLGQNFKSDRACSFCTALALLTLQFWAVDFQRRFDNLPSISEKYYSLSNILAMANNLERQLKLFVSYSSADLLTVTKLVDVLKAQGYDVIFAEYDLLIGDSIPGFINDALASMDLFIMCLSPDAVTSRYVKDEIDGAKASEWSKQKKTILPVLLRSCEIPPIIAAKRYADFTCDFDNGLLQLMRTLEKSGKIR